MKVGDENDIWAGEFEEDRVWPGDLVNLSEIDFDESASATLRVVRVHRDGYSNSVQDAAGRSYALGFSGASVRVLETQKVPPMPGMVARGRFNATGFQKAQASIPTGEEDAFAYIAPRDWVRLDGVPALGGWQVSVLHPEMKAPAKPLPEVFGEADFEVIRALSVPTQYLTALLNLAWDAVHAEYSALVPAGEQENPLHVTIALNQMRSFVDRALTYSTPGAYLGDGFSFEDSI